MFSQKTILVSVDVEGLPLSNGIADYSSVARGVPILLELFEEFKVHSTFFVTGDALERSLGVLGEILKRRHEIGYHGYRQDKSSRQQTSIEEDTNAISRLLKVTPEGFRAHRFKINAQTLRILTELGYKYDSSIISPSNMLSGQYFRNAPKTPYYPSSSNIYTEGDSSILEIPVSTLPIVNLPLALSYMKLCGIKLYKTLLPSTKQRLLTLYLHPYDLFPLPSGVTNVPFYFRMAPNVGEGLHVLREALESFEELFSPKYACAKSIAAQCTPNRASSPARGKSR